MNKRLPETAQKVLSVFILILAIAWPGCSKKPETVQELFPNALFDEKAKAKLFGLAAEGNQPMIDNLEDGDLNGLKLENRNWSWSQFDDASDGIQYLTIVQQADAPGAGSNVLYVKGGNWKYTGAGLSVWLVNRVSPRPFGYYDASIYAGIRFWVKAIGLQQLKIAISTPETSSLDEGGICMANCADSFTCIAGVSNNWIQIKIPFEEFILTEGKYSLALDPSRIKGIHLSIETLGDYEVWLDELSFY